MIKAVLLVFAVAVAGCASTATTSQFSIPVVASEAEPNFASYSESDPVLVKLSFPATFTAEAGKIASQRILDAFLSENDAEDGDSEEREKMRAYFSASETLNDSTYLTMELYDALSKRLPRDSVVIEPLRIELDEGRMVYRTMLPVETPPSLVNVLVTTISNPDFDSLMSGKYVTFGDVITPSFTVFSMLGNDNSTKTYALETIFQGICPNEVKKSPLIDCLNGYDALSSPLNFAAGYDANLIQAKKSRIDLHLYETKRDSVDEDGNSISEDAYQVDLATVEGSYARTFADLLALIESYSGDKYAEHLSDKAPFENSYLNVINEASTDLEMTGLRRAYLEKFYEKERNLLAKASDDLFSALYEKQFGEAFRKLLVLEASLLEERRSIIRKSNSDVGIGLLLSFTAGTVLDDADMMMSILEIFDARIVALEEQSIDLQNAFSNEFKLNYFNQIEAREDITVDGTAISGNLEEWRSQFYAILSQ